MKKQIVVYPQNRIKLNNKKDIDIYSIWINLKIIMPGEKKAEYIPYNFIYI